MGANRTLGSLAVGSIIKSEVGGVLRNFIVVHQGKPSAIYSSTFDNSTILMQEDIYEKRQWHSTKVNNYAASTIHAYLNGDFLNLFSDVIKNNVKQVKIPYRTGEGYDKTVTSGEYGLACKMWIPSTYELGYDSSTLAAPADGAKFDFFLSGNANDANVKRRAYLNGSATDWWLRSPYCYAGNGSTSAWSIYPNGGGTSSGCSLSLGVRPVLALPSTLFVSPLGALTEEATNMGGMYVKQAGIWVPVM